MRNHLKFYGNYDIMQAQQRRAAVKSAVFIVPFYHLRHSGTRPMINQCPSFQPDLGKLSPWYSSTEDMLDACAQGESQAWRVFMDIFNPIICARIRAKVRRIKPEWARQVEAQDVADMVYCELLHDNFDALKQIRDPNRIVTYLLSIASNIMVDLLHGIERHEQVVSGSFSPPSRCTQPDQAAMRAERLRVIDKALSRLSSEERAMAEMHYFQNMDYKEIAAQLGLKVGCVGMRLTRIRSKLKRVEALREMLSWDVGE